MAKHRAGTRHPSARDLGVSPAAVAFFYKWAGSSYDPKKETKAQGRRRGARELARAEAVAKARGWHVKWEDSQEPYEMGDAETEMPSEVLNAILYDENNHVIGSLSQIGDPSREYGRVVEAELASEGARGRERTFRVANRSLYVSRGKIHS